MKETSMKEVKQLLGDMTMYTKLDHNPFPDVVCELNERLNGAKEVGLLSKREFEHLLVKEFNMHTFYIIPKVHK